MILNTKFVKDSYENSTNYYSNAVYKIGLWDSEKYVFTKYLKVEDRVLDLGCGAGRTTLSLYNLGYSNILGLDISNKMIETAKNITSSRGCPINFIIRDACHLYFKDSSFEGAIFSFNGFMQIPGKDNREKALLEIKRILVDKGIFIFTSHERYHDQSFSEFWDKQELLWEGKKTDSRLSDFGDIITLSDHESKSDTYLHIPTFEEVSSLISNCGFEIIETFMRDDLFKESEKIKEFASDCRFYVIQKK